MNKKWEISSDNGNPKTENGIIDVLLKNRGIKNKEEFLNPLSPDTLISRYPDALGILKSDLKKAEKLIKDAISSDNPIFIHGDYDVDGICAAAILWETIYKDLGYKNCLPFIPNRFEHGYGLSISSIDEIEKSSKKQETSSKNPLLITVDCGIVSEKEVEYAKKKGFKVIVTDHHVKPKKLPDADAILQTEKLCGAGIAWVLSRQAASGERIADREDKYLDLVALATISDLQPLTGANRSLVKYGLEELNKKKRIGIKTLCEVGGFGDKKLSTYEVGWMIGPRLNAAGRLDSALSSLKLLVTGDPKLAKEIASDLNRINFERQQMTRGSLEQAIEIISSQDDNILIAHHEDFHEGVIGLVAGRLTRKFYKPSVVISVGEVVSKGSARSVSGFNLVEALREMEDIFENVGGHEMAAGFSIKNDKIPSFLEKFTTFGNENVSEDLLVPTLKIDCELSFIHVAESLWENLEKLAPHGIGNPNPVFLTRDVEIVDLYTVGAQGNHFKMKLEQDGKHMSAIYFNGEDGYETGDRVDVVYNLSLNEWQGRRNLELVLKDLKKTE